MDARCALFNTALLCKVIMNSEELRQKFGAFFREKGHRFLPPSSLRPENDPSVLFTSAGMQQFKPYYIKPELTKEKRLVSIQPCFRTSDIDEVGDKTHLTLFEMVGNFSFGYNTDKNRLGMPAVTDGGTNKYEKSIKLATPYFKEEAIAWAWQFLTGKKWLALDPKKFVGTYFAGNDALDKDEESKRILLTLNNLEKVEGRGQEENFWGPTGFEGPCGPTVEFHYDGVEVWNLVFNEFYFKSSKYTPLPLKGVDTGAGLERLLLATQSLDNVFQTDLLSPLVDVVRAGGVKEEKDQRIIADHIKAATFAIADGVLPSNKDAGYVVRRLLRRSLVVLGGVNEDLLTDVAQEVVRKFAPYYPQLQTFDLTTLAREIKKWQPVMERGKRVIEAWLKRGTPVSGKEAFDLYQSHGFPVELTNDLAGAGGVKVDVAGFWNELDRHKQISRAGVGGKFKGGLAGHSAVETRYHTATHLLLAALREVLGEKVFQRGASINTERLRLDFSFERALLPAELEQVESIVNSKIEAGLPVTCAEMATKRAKEQGAIGVFDERYGEKVKIYSIGFPQEVYSMEICGGPHVKNTAEIGQFKIIKQESAGAGIRRVRAHLL